MIATELKCPECQGLSVADSQAPTSQAIRPTSSDASRRAERRQRSARPTSTSTARRSCCRRRTPGLSLIVWVLPVVVLALGATASCSRCARNRDEPQLHATDADERLVERERAMAERSRCPNAERQLEEERDFLMQSLDDLELEHESGGIDDESYAELHDDYTARAAAAIRTLRDGVDARAGARTAVAAQRRVADRRRRGRVRGRSRGCRSRRRWVPASPGETSSGNSTQHRRPTNVPQQTAGSIESLAERRSTRRPTTTTCACELADAYEENNDLPTAIEQSDAAITIDPEPSGRTRQLGVRCTSCRSRCRRQERAGPARRAGPRRADQAITVGPDYADAYFFRGVLYAATGELGAAQADLQTYLVRRPTGTWSRLGARQLLAEVTTALEARTSTTVPPIPLTIEEEAPHGPAPDFEIDDSKIYRATITTDRGTIVMDLDPKLAPNTVNNFVALARQGYYDGLTFHRVVPGFVIQGGCPDGTRHRRARATSSTTSRCRASTRSARWRWPTPGRTPTARSSSSATDDCTRKLDQELQPLRLRRRRHGRRARHAGGRRDASPSSSRSTTVA